MNWFVEEGTYNTYSVHQQRLLSLSECCISSLVSSIKCSYSECENINSVTLINDAISQVLNYFQSNLLKSGSDQPLLPHWISDKLLSHFIADENVPKECFNRLFSISFCSLSEVSLPIQNEPYILDRFSQLCTFALTSLNLSDCFIVTDSILQSFPNRTAVSLKILKLRNCQKFQRISSLNSFVNLTHLDLGENILDFEGLVPVEILCFALKSFPNLRSLDLHFTNFPDSFFEIRDYKTLLEIHYNSANDLYSNLQLRELILYTVTNFNAVDISHLILFYTALSKFTTLTHLDLSAWSALDEVPDVMISHMSHGLIFFGLYHTPLTQLKKSLSIDCNEIAGSANEEQILTTVQHYCHVYDYMALLYSDIFNFIVNKLLSFSTDTTVKLIRLILDPLDQYINVYACNNALGVESDTAMLLRCTACLYALLKRDLPSEVISHTMKSCVALFNEINIESILQQSGAYLATNTCLAICFLITDQNNSNLQINVNYFISKCIFAVIHKSCDYSWLLLSPNHHLYKLLNEMLRLFCNLVIHKDPEQKSFIGQKLGGIKTLMRLIALKFDQKESDDHIKRASSGLMSLTYHSLPNCLELSQKLHSDLLVKLIEEYSTENKLEIVDLVMASLENIAEFCLKDEKASVSYQMLSPVLAVLSNPHKYHQDAVACAISIPAYYALGAEMWNWEEKGEQALDLAVEAIHQIDYKTPRSYYLDTLEMLIDCLHARDARVALCALWVICNLIYKQPDIYIKLLGEKPIEKIRTISNSYPEDTQYHILAFEILLLYDITKKCAQRVIL
ncbi:Protein zer-1-like [Oopsacas minuta]|uniref:Protein zer-1-like n=1 Tax=Oopsacas minuta TaxID=111878 RepID=A0AAV7K3I5_9METZ|nr:Protein zer-1-like [Oopsacas minuta]